MKLTYHWEGDYLIPDLVAPKSPHIGIWGERRRHFLRKHRKPIYDAMLMRGTLNAHLEEVDRSAENMMERITEQLSAQEGITELLKAENQIEWILRRDNIQNHAEEIMLHDLICT